MTEGKLVRDLIPEIIRKSGRHPEVRYLSGTELVGALVAKLCEEAREVGEAFKDRECLVQELADLTEVISAPMSVGGVGQQEVFDVVEAKAALRGRFTTIPG